MIKIINIILAILAGFGAVFGIYKTGKKEGIAEEKYKQKQSENEELERIIESERKINNIPADDIRKFLRS